MSVNKWRDSKQYSHKEQSEESLHLPASELIEISHVLALSSWDAELFSPAKWLVSKRKQVQS
jgi:hypothetical protein